MKKAIKFVVGTAVVLSLCVSFVFAAVPDGWTTSAADAFTVNSDKSITIKSTGNFSAQLTKEITGDFTLEFQVNAPAVIENTDQKPVIAVMCTGAEWISGYWFRITAEYVQFHDGTDGKYTETPANSCTINEKGMNNIKIQRVGNKLTYTVNGTIVADQITPAVTTGKYICIGCNYAFINGATVADLTESFTIRGMKLTIGSETFKYFGETDDTVVNPSPASSTPLSSTAVSSAPAASITIVDEEAKGGCGNKAK